MALHIATRRWGHQFPSMLRRERILQMKASIAVIDSNVRSLATTAEPPNDTYTLRYLRASKDQKPLRWLLGLSSFNMAYFGWYCIDFVPSVNKGAIARFEAGEIDQATLELLWVDSSLGYAGR